MKTNDRIDTKSIFLCNPNRKHTHIKNKKEKEEEEPTNWMTLMKTTVTANWIGKYDKKETNNNKKKTHNILSLDVTRLVRIVVAASQNCYIPEE